MFQSRGVLFQESPASSPKYASGFSYLKMSLSSSFYIADISPWPSFEASSLYSKNSLYNGSFVNFAMSVGLYSSIGYK